MELATERPVRPESPGNLQAWARDVRYTAAARLAEARDATIVTGHTADDQVETILYRLASSPSRRALLGMKERDGRLARPLLGTTRAEVTAYYEERGLGWREDATNAEEGYARNRVRHGLLPELEAIHPAAVANVLRTAALLRDEAEVLDALVAAELDGSGAAPRGRIAPARFAALPPALRRLVLQRLADAAAGRPVPGAARFADQVAGLTPRRLAARPRRRRPRRARGRRPAGRARPEPRRAPHGPPPRLRPVNDPAIGATLVSSEELQKRIAELGARSPATTRARTWSWSAC